MTNLDATARKLVRTAIETAAVSRDEHGRASIRFDARNLTALDQFSRSADRLNAVSAALDAFPTELILAAPPGIKNGSAEAKRIADAVQASVDLKDRHERPRGRLYRQGPGGFEALEV
jgi:hypothetical protein